MILPRSRFTAQLSSQADIAHVAYTLSVRPAIMHVVLTWLHRMGCRWGMA